MIQKIFNWAIGGIVIILLFLSVSLNSSVPQIVAKKLGEYKQSADNFGAGLFAGQLDQLEVDTKGELTLGGSVFATTTMGTVTIVNTDLLNNHTIAVTPAVGTVTFTLPTSANITAANSRFLLSSSDTVTKWLVNATTTTTSGAVKIVGNTGVIVRNVSTSTAADLIYSGQEARIDLRRSATSTDIYADVTIFH